MYKMLESFTIVEQKPLTLSSFVGFVYLNRMLSEYCFVDYCLPYYLIVFSYLLRFTSSNDYPFGGSKLFLQSVSRLRESCCFLYTLNWLKLSG